MGNGSHLRDRACKHSTERGVYERQGRPDFFKPAFFSLVNLAELLSTIRIRFEMSLKVEVVSTTSEVGQHFKNQTTIPRCGVDICRGRNCQAGLQFESR